MQLGGRAATRPSSRAEARERARALAAHPSAFQAFQNAALSLSYFPAPRHTSPLNHEQRAALAAIARGACAFITGPAGTGKSFLIESLKTLATRAGRPVRVTASVGMAARNITQATGGRVKARTAHSMFGLKPGNIGGAKSTSARVGRIMKYFRRQAKFAIRAGKDKDEVPRPFEPDFVQAWTDSLTEDSLWDVAFAEEKLAAARWAARRGSGAQPLSAEEARKRRWRAIPRDAKRCLIIIDEVSVMTAEVIEEIDAQGRAVRDALGAPCARDLPFGGAQVVVVGDVAQLAIRQAHVPSVGEASRRTGHPPEHTAVTDARKWGTWFPVVCSLSACVRQRADPAFGELLNRARLGKVRRSDLLKLRRAVVPGCTAPVMHASSALPAAGSAGSAAPAASAACTVLFPFRAQVAEFNAALKPSVIGRGRSASIAPLAHMEVVCREWRIRGEGAEEGRAIALARRNSVRRSVIAGMSLHAQIMRRRGLDPEAASAEREARAAGVRKALDPSGPAMAWALRRWMAERGGAARRRAGTEGGAGAGAGVGARAGVGDQDPLGGEGPLGRAAMERLDRVRQAAFSVMWPLSGAEADGRCEDPLSCALAALMIAEGGVNMVGSVCVGERVMISCNMDTKRGMVNGAPGRIVGWAPPLPSDVAEAAVLYKAAMRQYLKKLEEHDPSGGGRPPTAPKCGVPLPTPIPGSPADRPGATPAEFVAVDVSHRGVPIACAFSEELPDHAEVGPGRWSPVIKFESGAGVVPGDVVPPALSNWVIESGGTAIEQWPMVVVRHVTHRSAMDDVQLFRDPGPAANRSLAHMADRTIVRACGSADSELSVFCLAPSRCARIERHILKAGARAAHAFACEKEGVPVLPSAGGRGDDSAEGARLRKMLDEAATWVPREEDGGLHSQGPPRNFEPDESGADRVRVVRQVNLCVSFAPIVPCSAVTIHKGQGLTLDRIAVSAPQSNNFAPGLMYVALSRARELRCVELERVLVADDFVPNASAVLFYRALKKARRAARTPTVAFWEVRRAMDSILHKRRKRAREESRRSGGGAAGGDEGECSGDEWMWDANEDEDEEEEEGGGRVTKRARVSGSGRRSERA